MADSHRVVIIGGGFGGLHAARALRKAPVDVTLIDRQNYHLFQPLLYQVATGGLSPANIASPLRAILARQKNARVLLAEVVDIDVRNRRVIFPDGEEPYDSLIVAAGAGSNYFGHDDWASLAPGLKSIADATELRRRVLLAFEAAERETDPDEIARWLTFVIVGGGPTGVELAGALAELSRDTLTRQFRSIDPAHARILLVQGGERILPSYDESLSKRATEDLAKLGVEIHVNSHVTNIRDGEATITRDHGDETIDTRTVLWGAGVKCGPLGKVLADAAGVEVDHIGRVPVAEDLTIAGRPDVFVIGDLAHFEQDGAPLPGVAPVAIQQGLYAASTILRRLKGRPSPAFHYKDYGAMATIGRAKAVAQLGRRRFTGFLAWLIWLFIHLLQLVQFENRMLVLVQWAWSFVTWNRAARLITGESPFPLVNSTRNGEEEKVASACGDEQHE